MSLSTILQSYLVYRIIQGASYFIVCVCVCVCYPPLKAERYGIVHLSVHPSFRDVVNQVKFYTGVISYRGVIAL